VKWTSFIGWGVKTTQGIDFQLQQQSQICIIPSHGNGGSLDSSILIISLQTESILKRLAGGKPGWHQLMLNVKQKLGVRQAISTGIDRASLQEAKRTTYSIVPTTLEAYQTHVPKQNY